MANLEEQIISVLARKSYQPLKPKALARKLGLPPSRYQEFRHALRSLVKMNRAERSEWGASFNSVSLSWIYTVIRQYGDVDRITPAVLLGLIVLAESLFTMAFTILIAWRSKA